MILPFIHKTMWISLTPTTWSEFSLTGSLVSWHKAHHQTQPGNRSAAAKHCLRTVADFAPGTHRIWIIPIQNYVTYDEIAMIRELENFQRIHRRVCILLDSRRDVRVGSAGNPANQWRSRSILEFKKLHVELYVTALSYILKCPLLCSFLQDLQFSSFFLWKNCVVINYNEIPISF